MKQTPEYQAIQQQMAPGVITLDGFLGTDTRNLIDIIASDDARVHALNVTHEAIAERMQYFRDAGLDGLGEFLKIDGKLRSTRRLCERKAAKSLRWQRDVRESEHHSAQPFRRQGGDLHRPSHPFRT